MLRYGIIICFGLAIGACADDQPVNQRVGLRDQSQNIVRGNDPQTGPRSSSNGESACNGLVSQNPETELDGHSPIFKYENGRVLTLCNVLEQEQKAAMAVFYWQEDCDQCEDQLVGFANLWQRSRMWSQIHIVVVYGKEVIESDEARNAEVPELFDPGDDLGAILRAHSADFALLNADYRHGYFTGPMTATTLGAMEDHLEFVGLTDSPTPPEPFQIVDLGWDGNENDGLMNRGVITVK